MCNIFKNHIFAARCLLRFKETNDLLLTQSLSEVNYSALAAWKLKRESEFLFSFFLFIIDIQAAGHTFMLL